jgi:flagellin
MTSMLTNTAAMVALQTLRDINTNLDQTNNRVSTGLRVNTAADNAAYWSISTTIKSDNGALGAVTDSLNLGASTLSTTYTGLNTAITTLNDIKNQLTTATGANVDKAKVQQTIASDLAQLQSIADGAAFSGQNWLSTGTASGTAFDKTIVSSVSRDSNNLLSIGSIDVNISAIHLYGNSTGILDKTIALTGYQADSGAGSSVQTTPIDFANAADAVTFSVTPNGGSTTQVTINQTTLTNAGFTDTSIRSYSDLAKVMNQALTDAGVSGITASVNASGHVVFDSQNAFTVGAASVGATGDAAFVALAAGDFGLASAPVAASTSSTDVIAVKNIDITLGSVTSDTITNYLKVVDQALSEVTSAASAIGAVQNRVTSQQNFVKALSDANTTAVGALVDANMEEESTKLKALQTQQQLAVQSLSIANASTQNILTLFR